MALLHPDRVAGLCTLSVPFAPRAHRPPLEIWAERLADRFFYIRHLREPGVADAELDADPERTVKLVFGRLERGVLLGPDDGRGHLERFQDVDSLPPWLPPEDPVHYVETFARTGSPED